MAAAVEFNVKAGSVTVTGVDMSVLKDGVNPDKTTSPVTLAQKLTHLVGEAQREITAEHARTQRTNAEVLAKKAAAVAAFDLELAKNPPIIIEK